MKMSSSRDVEGTETRDPLLEDSTFSSHDEKEQWGILKYIDMCFTSTVLCFFIVACWTGTSTLLDIYSDYFPMTESFLLSIFVHFVFAMSQKFFHDLLIEKPSKDVFTKCVNWVLHKIYFLIFYVTGVMNWRSGSFFFEEAFGITDDSTINDFGVILSLIATFVCCVILMWLGGMGNVSSSPMLVSLDCKSEAFLFNYKFFKVAYILIFLSEPYQIANGSITDAHTKNPVKEPGRPFEVRVLGPPPQEFIPTTLAPRLSTKTSPPLSTHRQLYKQHQYPKNIQEIISYITNQPRQKYTDNMVTDSYLIGEELAAANSDYVYNSTPDKFYSYKPRDISEVNLLAKDHVRFSPPAWKNFQKFNKIPLPIHNSAIDTVTRMPHLSKNTYKSYQQQTNPGIPLFASIPTVLNIPNTINKARPESGDVVATVQKPLLVNINIAPMEDNERHSKNPDLYDAMNLQLKVYPDMTLFPEYRKKYQKNRILSRLGDV